jgi:hypothetical protein
MPNIYTANMAGEKAPGKSPHSAGEVYVSDGYIDLVTELEADDLIQLCILPPKCIPLGFSIECEDLDSVADLTLTAALMLRAGTDILTNYNFFVDSAVAQAGGLQGKEWIAASFDNLRTIYSDTVEALVALKVTTAPATWAAGAVRGALTYRSVEQQDR